MVHCQTILLPFSDRIKRVTLASRAPYPIDRAISSAGGIALDDVDKAMMLKKVPGVFAAGEMLDWEAPTGGYLLQACFATAHCAGFGDHDLLGNGHCGAKTMTILFVDADACPVKDEAVRVGERHRVEIKFVSNSWMRLPEGDLIERVVVPEGPDEADNWIAERAKEGDVVVTADVPLAARCVKAGALVIGPTGENRFREDGIGMRLAMRDLNTHLRETGEIRGRRPVFLQGRPVPLSEPA